MLAHHAEKLDLNRNPFYNKFGNIRYDMIYKSLKGLCLAMINAEKSDREG